MTIVNTLTNTGGEKLSIFFSQTKHFQNLKEENLLEKIQLQQTFHSINNKLTPLASHAQSLRLLGVKQKKLMAGESQTALPFYPPASLVTRYILF